MQSKMKKENEEVKVGGAEEEEEGRVGKGEPHGRERAAGKECRKRARRGGGGEGGMKGTGYVVRKGGKGYTR